MAVDRYPAFKVLEQKIIPVLRRIRAAEDRILRTARSAVWAIPVALLVLIIVAFVGYYASIFYGKTSVNRKLAELRTRGEQLDVWKFAPEPVPDNQNAALLYLKAYDSLSSQQLVLTRWNCPVKLPRAISVWCCLSQRPNRSKEASRRDAVNIIAKGARAFSLMEQAGTCHGSSYINWKNAYPIRSDYLGKLGLLSTFLDVKFETELESGNIDAAIHDVEMMLSIARSVHQEPGMEPFRIQTALIRQAVQASAKVVNTSGLTISQIQRLYRSLSGLSIENDFPRALLGQRAIDNNVCQSDRREAKVVGMLVDNYLYENNSSPKILRDLKDMNLVSIKTLWQPFSYKDQMVLLNRWDTYLSYSGMPYRDLATNPPRNNDTLPRYCLLSRYLVSGMTRDWLERDFTLAMVNVTKATLSLEAYKARYGRYPGSLADLKEYSGRSAGEDPFSGGELKYKRNGDEFVLYSIGPDLKDDGGAEGSDIRL